MNAAAMTLTPNQAAPSNALAARPAINPDCVCFATAWQDRAASAFESEWRVR